VVLPAVWCWLVFVFSGLEEISRLIFYLFQGELRFDDKLDIDFNVFICSVVYAD
jgi:hypothetical protein